MIISWPCEFDTKDRYVVPLLVAVCGTGEPVQSAVPSAGDIGGLVCWGADTSTKGMRIICKPSEVDSQSIVWEPLE